MGFRNEVDRLFRIWPLWVFLELSSHQFGRLCQVVGCPPDVEPPPQVLANGCRSVGVNEVTGALTASVPGEGDLR